MQWEHTWSYAAGEGKQFQTALSCHQMQWVAWGVWWIWACILLWWKDVGVFACLPLIKACGMATPIFLRTGTLGWPSPSDGLTQLSLPGMVGKLVCSFNVYYGSADGLAQGITTSVEVRHVPLMTPSLYQPWTVVLCFSFFSIYFLFFFWCSKLKSRVCRVLFCQGNFYLM